MERTHLDSTEKSRRRFVEGPQSLYWKTASYITYVSCNPVAGHSITNEARYFRCFDVRCTGVATYSSNRERRKKASILLILSLRSTFISLLNIFTFTGPVGLVLRHLLCLLRLSFTAVAHRWFRAVDGALLPF